MSQIKSISNHKYIHRIILQNMLKVQAKLFYLLSFYFDPTGFQTG